MSNHKNTKNLTPFGQFAMMLDGDFAEIEQLGGQIERLSIESESGLNRAKELLVKFTESGQRVSQNVQGLAKTLEEARGRAEKAAQTVADRALLIQQRQQECDQMVARFRLLGETVQKVSGAIGKMKKPSGKNISDEEKKELLKELPELDRQLGILSDEAQKLKGDAHRAKFKSLDRNAESLTQTLKSARRKLAAFLKD